MPFPAVVVVTVEVLYVPLEMGVCASFPMFISVLSRSTGLVAWIFFLFCPSCSSRSSCSCRLAVIVAIMRCTSSPGASGSCCWVVLGLFVPPRVLSAVQLLPASTGVFVDGVALPCPSTSSGILGVTVCALLRSSSTSGNSVLVASLWDASFMIVSSSPPVLRMVVSALEILLVVLCALATTAV